MTVTLANGGKAEKRRELDFYPTPPEVTVALLAFLKLEPCTIWEPACGDGAMSMVLEAAGHQVLSSDLRVSGYGEGGVDFLTCAAQQCDAIVTNPPFNISEDFVRRALSVTNTVAMVLKSQYWHAAKRKALFDQFPPAYILPMTWRPDFMGGERGGAPTMDCIWTVWAPHTGGCIYQPLARPARALQNERIAQIGLMLEAE
jgi:hypothetical protein